MTWRCRADSVVKRLRRFSTSARVDFGLLLRLDRVADAREQARLIERLLDEIKCADLDGSDSHVDIAMTGYR